MLCYSIQHDNSEWIFVGDTAYSKKWVLSVLLHMMEDEKSSGDCHDASDGNDVSDYNGPTNGAEKDDTDAKDSELELNRKDETNQIKQSLEEELCELWDMTMDSVCFLQIILGIA